MHIGLVKDKLRETLGNHEFPSCFHIKHMFPQNMLMGLRSQFLILPSRPENTGKKTYMYDYVCICHNMS